MDGTINSPYIYDVRAIFYATDKSILLKSVIETDFACNVGFCCDHCCDYDHYKACGSWLEYVLYPMNL